jgi:small subunit ribosomal protein S17
MARKTLTGFIVSDKMTNTVLVEVTRQIVHPLYKKRMKSTKKHAADTNGMVVTIGDFVRIEEIPPMSKTKHFKVTELITKGISVQEIKEDTKKDEKVSDTEDAKPVEVAVSVEPKKAEKKAKTAKKKGATK